MMPRAVLADRANGRGAKRVPLSALGRVRGGYVAPSSHTEADSSPLLGLQPSDVAPDGTIRWTSLRPVQPVRDGVRYEVREGDVLLPLRSTRLVAVVARDVPAEVIAVGHWLIISLDPSRATPEFLAWYLNHPTTTQRLRTLSKGSSLQFLPLSGLRDFEVEVPPWQTQDRIVRVMSLHRRITELEQQIAHTRQQLVDAIALEALRITPSSPTPTF